MSAFRNLVNSVDAKSSAKRGLKFTAKQLQQLHWNEGVSMLEIGKRYDVSGAAICYWFKKLGVQHRSNLRTVLFEPSPALSYVIGCILGDGCVNERKQPKGTTIRLQVKDLEFAESFAAAIRLIGIRCSVIPLRVRNKKHSPLFLAYSYSNQFGKWWQEIGRDGAAKFARAFPADFVRGFYEAEGTIKFHRNRLEMGITNTDEKLIKSVESCIPSGIRRTVLKFGPYMAGRKARYDICINNQLDIKRFLAWTMPCIKRQPRNANTEPMLLRDGEPGVENTKAIQNGTRVGTRRAIGVSQPQARAMREDVFRPCGKP